MMGEEYERSKAFLQITNHNNTSLYDHISNLIMKIVDEKKDPKTALDNLEELSLSLKNTSFSTVAPTELAPNQQLKSKNEKLYNFYRDNLNRVQEMMQVDKQLTVKQGELQTKQENLLQTAHLLNLVGVGFSSEAMLELQHSIQVLIKSQQLKQDALVASTPPDDRFGLPSVQLASTRFWGIIHGKQRDYYIVESKFAKYEKHENYKPPMINREEVEKQKAERRARRAAWEQLNKEREERDEEPLEYSRWAPGEFHTKTIKPIYDQSELAGSGVNEYVYFVSSGVRDCAWKQLPNLTPQQIITSRFLHRYLTGDLNAPVQGFPKFPGREAEYLRAIIARISASTLVSPRDYFTLEEVDEQEVLSVDAEYEGVGAAELVEQGSWLHHRQHLLKSGRTTLWEEPEKDEDEEDEEEEEEEEPEENDGEQEEEEPEEPLPLLSSLEDDACEGYTQTWSFRCYPKPTHPHAIVCARSLLWPGALAVAKKKEVVNIYVGDGMKYRPQGFTPQNPPAVQAEYVAKFDEEENETDPLQEQSDPLPPADLQEEKDEDEENEDEEEEEEEEEEVRGDEEEEDD